MAVGRRIKGPNGLCFPPFKARLPWLGGDLQTVRNIATRASVDLAAWPEERVRFDLSGGDSVTAPLHRPADAVPERPLIAIIHGLTGCEDSIHVRATARHFLSRGYPVLRMNLRGSLPSRPTCGGYYHAGHSDDIAAMFDQIEGFRHVVALGFSLGGNVLLKHLGEAGAAARLGAAVGVSVPLNLSATSHRMRQPRNRLYHAYILGEMQREALAEGAILSERERAAIRNARSVFAFDDQFIAPRFGFDGGEDYYAQSCALNFLDAIRRPTLAIHARNDPWIPIAGYMGYDWTRNRALHLLLSESGGHVGFHGREALAAWHDRCALHFVESVFSG